MAMKNHSTIFFKKLIADVAESLDHQLVRYKVVLQCLFQKWIRIPDEVEWISQDSALSQKSRHLYARMSDKKCIEVRDNHLQSLKYNSV